jgi:hypothetical protein
MELRQTNMAAAVGCGNWLWSNATLTPRLTRTVKPNLLLAAEVRCSI